MVRFDAAAQVDLERLRQRFPDRFAAGQLSSSGGGSALQMVLPGGGGGVRHFRSGNSIAIDLRYGSAAVTAASPQASTETSPAGSGGAAGSQLAQATAAPAPAAPADPTDVPPPRESRNAAPTSPPSTTPAPAPDAAAAPAPASDQTPSSPPAPAVAADGSVPPPRPDGRVQPPPEQTETAAPEGPSGVGPQRVAQEATPVETDPADAEPVPSVLGATDNPAENSPVEGLERLAASRQDVPERQYDREIYSMSFSWDRPVAAAAFRRAGYLWVVFSAWQEVDMRVLRVTAGEALLFAEQVDIGRDATAVRMVVDPIFSPSFRREGLLWIMDLQRGPMRPDVPIAVTPQPQSPAGPRLYLSVAEGGDAITFNDPEVGDPLIVVPVVPLGQGIFPERRLPDLTLPVTAQGILIEPKTDDLQVIPSRQGVEISSAAGLRFTTDADRLLAMSGLGADDGLSSIFNIPAWRGNPQQHFSTRRAQALEAVSIAPRSRRNDARLELARFYFANGYAPEALGVLRTILADGGEGFLNRPSFRAVRGGSNLLMGRYRDAVDDLSHPGLADVD
ncbi:MAG: tetratricopeptide repeat protein, partial [Rhodospirillaceae bacterium]